MRVSVGFSVVWPSKFGGPTPIISGEILGFGPSNFRIFAHPRDFGCSGCRHNYEELRSHYCFNNEWVNGYVGASSLT